ncbi:MAG: diguanylate cyclase [Elusimicrobiota bacterium]
MTKKTARISSHFKLLRRHISVLRETKENLQSSSMSLEEALERSLWQLFYDLGYDRAMIFFYDQEKLVLQTKQMMHLGEVLAGEEEIVLPPDNPLYELIVDRERDYWYEKQEYALYLPLLNAGRTLGMLRVDNGIKKKNIPPADYILLADFANELAAGLEKISLLEENHQQVKRLLTFSEISTAIISSLRMPEVLRLMALSLIKNLYFDRVKLYLVDKKEGLLRGEVSAGLIGKISRINTEVYPLHSGINTMVDIVLEKKLDPMYHKFKQNIVYVPLKVRREIIGILEVDNILSQRKISWDDVELLNSFAGQVGLAIENARLFEEVDRLSTTDGLTRLYVFRYFKQRFNEELARSERFTQKLSLIMFDIDHFKEFNDSHGHLIGDMILVEVGKKVLQCIRKIDFAARYGGDEFIIFLPRASEEEAKIIASRIFHSIRDNEIKASPDYSLKLTVSLGIDTFPDHGKSGEELLKRVDEALYWAKTHGRDQMCSYSEIK